jgi:hypothetical protein
LVLRDTWSRRHRAELRYGHGDIFSYEDLPQPLRVQIFHLLQDTIGGWAESNPYAYAPSPPSKSNQIWAWLDKALADELGMFGPGQRRNSFQNFPKFFMQCRDIDQLLDRVEVTFRLIDKHVHHWTPIDRQSSDAVTPADEAIATLNACFLEHRVGYQYEAGRIATIDNQMVLAEVVLPTLQLLSDRAFAGPNHKFLTALNHLRHVRTKEAIVEATKSFESTIKTICDLRRWHYQATDTASKLIELVFQQGLILPYLLSEFTALSSVLESGATVIRDNTPAHGQGAVPVVVPEHLVHFAINSVAANIRFIVEARRQKGSSA